MLSESDSSRPIIGILCRRSVINKLKRQKASFRPKLIHKAGLEVRSKLYFFGAKDVNRKDKRILGTYFHEKEKKWKQKYFSLPHVLLRMGGQFYQTTVSAFFKKQNTKVLNKFKSFDKWEHFNVLQSNPQLSAHLPDTKHISLNKKKELFTFIDRHGSVYVKAAFGFQSKNIMKITKRKNGKYSYKYHISTFKKGIVSKTQLLKKMKRFFKNKTIIIQKTIPLLEYNKYDIDLRTELNRNEAGDIKVAGYCIRKSKKGNFTTRKSGKHKLKKYFRRTLKYSKKEINSLLRQIKQLTLKTYREIESKYGPIGEMGIDLGLDKNGKLWIIECNLCSGKRTLYKTYGAERVKQSYVDIFKYGISLL
ncbi:YheC/YheD family protein [Alteribacillus bidgolensis]|uniref:YheC/D like ATP-grasp n=1 Tax=Alteribacillus bidgolensis TaxID=930129 RepID=A0A1G8KUY6_9BACI|nr:YheC/YheD family protein [Alteribacillus bidgolensis]SDI47157.1 YheC/D like ATP-grasp [Alteribacillus bidgolensis]